MAVHDTCAGERCAPHYVLPQVVALGLVGDAHSAAEVYLEVSGFRKVDVDVCPVVISVIGVVRVVGQVELLHYAVLVEIAKGDEVAEAGRTSGQGDIVLGLPGLVLEDVVVPVHIREHYRVTAGFEHIQDEGAEFQGAFGDFRVVRPLGLIVYLCIFQAAHALKVTQRLGDSILGGEGDAVLAFLSALGGYEDDAVGAPHSEHRSRRCILEDRDVGYFIGVHLEEGPFNSVHEDQGL